MKQSPIPAISRRSLRGVEQQEQEEEDEERGRKEGKKEGAVEKMKRLLRVDSDETDDLHDKYRYRISTGTKVRYRISTGTKVEYKYRISTSTKIFETHPALFCE